MFLVQTFYHLRLALVRAGHGGGAKDWGGDLNRKSNQILGCGVGKCPGVSIEKNFTTILKIWSNISFLSRAQIVYSKFSTPVSCPGPGEPRWGCGGLLCRRPRLCLEMRMTPPLFKVQGSSESPGFRAVGPGFR